MTTAPGLVPAAAGRPENPQGGAEEGHALRVLGRLQEALTSCDRALSTRPDDVEMQILRAEILIQLNRPLEALGACDAAVAVRPLEAVAHVKRCTVLAILGRWEDLSCCVGRALELNGGSAALYTLRGLAEQGLGRLDEALDSYAEATARQPDYVPSLVNRAVVLRRLGRRPEAATAYEAVLASDPRHFEALHNLAGVLSDLGRYEEALDCCDRGLAIRPTYGALHLTRGAVLMGLRRFDEAEASYAQAGTTVAEALPAHMGRARALMGLHSPAPALAQFDRAIEIDGGVAEVHCGRAEVLAALGRMEEALVAYDRAIAIKRDYAEAHLGRGKVLAELDRAEAALASFENAVSVRADFTDAHFNRATMLSVLRRHEAARAGFERVRMLAPNFEFLEGQRRHARMQCCDWDGLEQEDAHLAGRIERGEPAATPFAVLAMSDSPALQAAAARIWARRRVAANPGLTPQAPARRKTAKIHLGYFSADFREHATMSLAAGLFEAHDRDQFRVTAFSFGPDSQDAMRVRLNAACDAVIDVRRRSDREVAQLARDLQVDVAVDVQGYTGGCRPGVFALRAAPLQVSYLAYPGTIGAEYMDYLVADRVVISPASRPHYSEKILYLPYSYQVNDAKRAAASGSVARGEFGLPATGFVFCCFNNSFKITPTVFDTWMRILMRTHGSVLWLLRDNDAAVRNLRLEAARRGVAPERLIFAERCPVAEHLERHRFADLFLDTLPYNAHTTASDALWAGLPVLTRSGDAFAGRVAASLLMALDLPELVVSTSAEYEALAIELAEDAVQLQGLRQRLLSDRTRSRLFDTVRYTRELECGYMAMIRRHDAGLPPDDIQVDPM
jgi:predicted O-linked N-acetylglucosamine transferase (SPINDLY family)